MKPLSRRTWLVTTAGFIAYARSPQAAADQQRVSIAVPEFSGDSVSDDVSRRNLTEIVVADLKASSRLLLIESNVPVEENLDAVPQFDKWRAIDTAWLVTGRITRKPDQRIVVQFRLWDVATRQQLMGAQYGLQPEDWRHVPHAIAESIIERLVGRS
jgi:TolB protein